jgi:hypothetical protein
MHNQDWYKVTDTKLRATGEFLYPSDYEAEFKKIYPNAVEIKVAQYSTHHSMWYDAVSGNYFDERGSSHSQEHLQECISIGKAERVTSTRHYTVITVYYLATKYHWI